MEDIIMSTRKTLSERIEEQLARKAEMEAEINRLKQQQKAAERKARTHRLIVRGGMLEGILPDTTKLTDEQFKSFLEKTTANKFGQSILAELLTGQVTEDSKNSSDSGKATSLKASELKQVNVETAATAPAQKKSTPAWVNDDKS